MADGECLLYVGGSKTAFQCECGCNVFRKEEKDVKETLLRFYKCNGCGWLYFYTESFDISSEEIGR